METSISLNLDGFQENPKSNESIMVEEVKDNGSVMTESVKIEKKGDKGDFYCDTGSFKNNFAIRTPVNTRKMMEDYVWECTKCDKELLTLAYLKLHYTQEHNEPPSFKCLKCGKIYTSYRSFLRHVKIHWNHECYSCNICGKEFAQKGILQSHMAGHSEERPFVCPECGKGFKQYSSLYIHSKCHLPKEAKPKFPCTECTKVFCSKLSKDTHMKFHKGEQNFICDICGRRFFAKGSLAYHIKTHDERKPYVCKICNKCFRTSHLLSKHSVLHTGEKPHQCDVCGKLFRERSTLKQHYRIHTGAMPFSCEYCGKLFRFKGILTVHRRLHTGERPYQCAICRREFTNWANYNKHLKRRHKPGSEGESENEIDSQRNQPNVDPTNNQIREQLDITSIDLNSTPSIESTPTSQDVFSLEPSLYDNLPLDLADPISNLYNNKVSPSYPTAAILTCSSLPTVIATPLPPPPLQLYYIQRYMRYPDYIFASPTLPEPVVIEDKSARPR